MKTLLRIQIKMDKISRFSFDVDLSVDKSVNRLSSQINRPKAYGIDFATRLGGGDSINSLLGPFPFSGTIKNDTYRIFSHRFDYWNQVKIILKEKGNNTSVEIIMRRYWMVMFIPLLFIISGTALGLYHLSLADYPNARVLGIFGTIGLLSFMFFHWQILRTVKYLKNIIVNAR